VGSANLSESAWGKIVRDAKRKENKLVCRNWECGVLVPAINSAKRDADLEIVRQADQSLSQLFRGCLDIPFDIPAPPYGDQDPWFFMKGQPQRRF
jgi:hypothetical protein